jgi:predicted small lipoprotein YifL
MSRTFRIVIVIALTLGAAACGKKGPLEPRPQSQFYSQN